jgi:tRNA(fMet)-specific endonuclease VapC
VIRYMLDTNVCIHVMRNRETPVRKQFNDNVGAMCISTVTLHELMHGVHRSARPTYQRELTLDLVSRLGVLEFDDLAANHSGDIHATLGKSGQLIGSYDMLIAGHARSRGLTIVTNNMREFTRVEGLICEDWLA